MRMIMLPIVLALSLIGTPQVTPAQPQELTVETVITWIQIEAPDLAAEVLLDWAEQGSAAEEEEVLTILECNALPPVETAKSFATVLDAADTLQEERSVDQTAYEQAVRSLSPLFTQVLKLESTPFQAETPDNPADLEQLHGMWYDSEMQELLIISEAGCRVIIPWLGYNGETALDVRLRDRSASGYAPALEIDIHESGYFMGPLSYYVSGVDEDHFWCNSQACRFDKLG